MTSIGRRGWLHAKASLAGKVDARVAPPIAELAAQIAELQDIVTVQIDVGNQTLELLGRLLESSNARLEAVEESLHQVTPAGVQTDGSNGNTEIVPRAKAAGEASGSEDPS